MDIDNSEYIQSIEEENEKLRKLVEEYQSNTPDKNIKTVKVKKNRESSHIGFIQVPTDWYDFMHREFQSKQS